jgi:hypothetical protein
MDINIHTGILKPAQNDSKIIQINQSNGLLVYTNIQFYFQHSIVNLQLI